MRFVAIGDSFTEGVGDELPDGRVRGWADLVAAGLSTALAERGEDLQYANLAVRGRLLHPIVTDQLGAALALEPAPDLLTFNGGGNDMLRPGVRLDRLLELTDLAIRRCVDAGVRPVVLSGADPTAQLPLGGLVRRRGTYLTAGVADLCARHQVTMVNVFGDEELRDPRYWTIDRLHLNSLGHERVAGLVLDALGYTQTLSSAVAFAQLAPTAARGLANNARYYRDHVLPWIHRRLRGRSSGDKRAAKHPVWNVVAPAQSSAAP